MNGTLPLIRLLERRTRALKRYLAAAVNVLAQNVGGMVLVLLGMAAARVF